MLLKRFAPAPQEVIGLVTTAFTRSWGSALLALGCRASRHRVLAMAAQARASPKVCLAITWESQLSTSRLTPAIFSWIGLVPRVLRLPQVIQTCTQVWKPQVWAFKSCPGWCSLLDTDFTWKIQTGFPKWSCWYLSLTRSSIFEFHTFSGIFAQTGNAYTPTCETGSTLKLPIAFSHSDSISSQVNPRFITNPFPGTQRTWAASWAGASLRVSN